MNRVASSRELVALMTRAREGDDRALEQFLAEVHVYLRRYFRRWIYHRPGWEDTIDDLAQEALIKIARGIGTCTASTDDYVITWCRRTAENTGIDYLRRMRDEWDVSVFVSEVEPNGILDWNPRESEIREDEGVKIMLRLLREAHESEGEDAQALVWHRLVQGDEWTETADEFGIPHTAAKRRFQRMQGRIRHAVLKKLVALAPDELSAARQWIRRIDLSDEEIMSVPSTRSVTRADA